MNPVLDQIYLLYRGPDHLRFELPEALCDAEAFAPLLSELESLEGMRRITADLDRGKLGLRFDPALLKAPAIYLSLGEALKNFKTPPRPKKTAAAPTKQAKPRAARAWSRFGGKLKLWPKQSAEQAPSGWLARAKAKWNEGRLAWRRLRRPDLVSQEVEDKVILVLNEVVIFYLIKRHWKVITEQWVKHPIRHGMEWFSLVYLTYLYVRHKKQQQVTD